MAESFPQGIVPALAEGAAHFNEGAYWDAHEAWEAAWLALRDRGRDETAHFVQGLILATAALENMTQGNAHGFRVQMAKALVRMRAHPGEGRHIGLVDEDGFREGLTDLFLGALQERGLPSVAGLDPPVPDLAIEQR